MSIPPGDRRDGGSAVGQEAMVEAAQRAVGVLAARRRDDAGAETLLASFPHDGARAFGFLLVSELALILLEKSTGEPTDALCQDLSLSIAGAFSCGDPTR